MPKSDDCQPDPITGHQDCIASHFLIPPETIRISSDLLVFPIVQIIESVFVRWTKGRFRDRTDSLWLNLEHIHRVSSLDKLSVGSMRRVDYTLWFQLGELQAKCEQVAGVPLLLPEVEEHSCFNSFWPKEHSATTAIEGNTLSEQDALELIRGKLETTALQESIWEQEITNIVNACNDYCKGCFSQVRSYQNDCQIGSMKELNALVLHDLPLREDVYPGKIREHDVGVGRYRGAPPQDCEYLLKELCQMAQQRELPSR